MSSMTKTCARGRARRDELETVKRDVAAIEGYLEQALKNAPGSVTKTTPLVVAVKTERIARMTFDRLKPATRELVTLEVPVRAI